MMGEIGEPRMVTVDIAARDADGEQKGGTWSIAVQPMWWECECKATLVDLNVLTRAWVRGKGGILVTCGTCLQSVNAEWDA